jgi:thiamine transporter ThiT
MDGLSQVKRSVFTAVCIALCVVLPMAFHAVPRGGNIFSPMHIPVFLAGLICGGGYGLLTGILGPLLSTLITGMPAFGFMPVMIVELAAYGLFSGIAFHFIRTGHVYGDLYGSLLTAMIVGRIIAGCARALIFAPGKFTMAAWISGYFVGTLPGIILQLVVIPLVYAALYRAGLIPSRYLKKVQTEETLH